MLQRWRNICASRRIPEQFDFENHHLPEPDKHQYDSDFEQEDYEFEADLEQQQACELLSNLESNSSVFAKYSQDRYEFGFYDHFANQDEKIDREGYLPQELPHLSYDFHNEESCSNQEEQDFQGLSNLQLEHQGDLPSPYEQVASNHDKELGNIFPDLFQNFTTDTPI